MDAFLVLIKMRYNRKGKTYEEEYGKERSIKIKKKISDSLKGQRISHLKKIGFKKGYIPWNKGKKTSLIVKEKLSKVHFGFKHSQATKDKLSQIKKGKKNPNYKNGIGGYRKKAFDNYPPQCNRCGFDNKKILIVHHIDLNRKNNDLDNLEIVCLNCHALIHNFNPIKNLGKYAVKKEER